MAKLEAIIESNVRDAIAKAVAESREDVIRDAIAKAVAESREDVIRDAVRDFEARLRNTMSRAAIEVSHFYSVETHGSQVIITIKDAREVK